MTGQANPSSFAQQGQAGLPDEFQKRVDPYSRELLVHCYRFFGSLEDAEDALQETYLRAWRRMDTLKEPAALRGWLYRIATNVSLDLIERSKTRALPSQLSLPSDPGEPLAEASEGGLWLQPLPDELLAGPAWNPEARYERNESVSLAFLALLQQLPGRQRAVLILRDVLGWSAQETAELLDASLAAVNSALQRARQKMGEAHLEQGGLRPEVNAPPADLLSRYVQAWESDDTAGLIRLLKDDAVLTMPPLPGWYQGREAIARFYRSETYRSIAPGPFRLLPARANGGPAFAVYQQGPDGAFAPVALHVLALDQGGIARIDTFLDLGEKQYRRFGLPLLLND